MHLKLKGFQRKTNNQNFTILIYVIYSQLLTPKEALESLMAKDPYNPTVKAFKKNGLLEEILYPDGRPEGKYNDRYN